MIIIMIDSRAEKNAIVKVVLELQSSHVFEKCSKEELLS